MAPGHVFTIGHGNQSREAVLEQLIRANVSFVVDVRSSPYSRFQPVFSREPLDGFLRESRIRYVFMGDLLGGRPDDDDCYTAGKVDYDKIREKDFFVRGIARLKSAYEQGLTICLLCSEGQPSQCHRSKLVADELVKQGIDVTHLLPDGSRRSQEEVIKELTKGQGSLFGEHFVSRKSYR
jgi:uncharacterized protein (DUF488 family)